MTSPEASHHASAEAEVETNTQLVTDKDNNANQFNWEFNLDEIDPSLVFDESTDMPLQSLVADPIGEPIPKSVPTFQQWLNGTIPDEVETSSTLVPAMHWANQESKQVSSKLAQISVGSLDSIGGALSSLMGLIGGCGPLCMHTLSAASNVGTASGLLSQIPAGKINPGFSVDKHGNFSLTGDLNTLSQATGFSKDQLLSGQYSAQDILSAWMSIVGSSVYHFFGFGIIDCLVTGLIPLPRTAAA